MPISHTILMDQDRTVILLYLNTFSSDFGARRPVIPLCVMLRYMFAQKFVASSFSLYASSSLNRSIQLLLDNYESHTQ